MTSSMVILISTGSVIAVIGVVSVVIYYLIKKGVIKLGSSKVT